MTSLSPAAPSAAAPSFAAAGAAARVAPTPVWPLAQRLLFRFALLYFVLYAYVPDGWGNSWWQPVTGWMHANGLAPYEVIHQDSGSSDTGHDFAKLLAVVALAATGTLAWSLVQRRSGHPVLGRWAHALLRFTLASHLLGYGLAKFFGGQFGELGPSRLTMQVGDLAPMTMVGTFMQASKPYELFGGGGEVLAALLLIHRRTAAVGALLAIGVMANVAALNWLCGVPVKLYSAHLLLFGIAVLLPFAPGLWALLVRARPAEPVDLRLVRGGRAGVVVAVLGWVLAVLWLANTVSNHAQPREWAKNHRPGPHQGVWQVERMLLDGAEVPRTELSRWRNLLFDRGRNGWVEGTDGQRQWLQIALADGGTQAVVQVRGRPPESEDRWTLEQGTKVVQVPGPRLRTDQPWPRVDEERRTLVVRGTWLGRQLEVHTVEKRFRLQTGFRLRQEIPDGW
jgi:hypothetical protein